MTEEVIVDFYVKGNKEEMCPFDHTRVCPHEGFTKYPTWCQCCQISQLIREVRLIGARQQ